MNGKVAKKIRKIAVKNADKIDEEIFRFIQAKAQQRTNSEEAYEDGREFNPSDSGNYDDAHEYGTEDGEIYFARILLAEIEKKMGSVNDSKPS